MIKKAVIAIGGNSLIRDKNHQTVEDQYRAVVETVSHIVDVIDHGYEVIITHGNGPQVGFILLRSEMASHKIHPVPLDSCGADTQGAIGYNIQMALGNEFRRRGMDKQAVTVVTQVLVHGDDPAFENPSKPIGPFYEEEEAREREKNSKWHIMEDSGRGWRRVVASPLPREIIEFKAIETLINSGMVVVAVGGGGIPVIRNGQGNLEGVAAVIDKDHASALLASQIQAELLIISTAVEQVSLNFATPEEKPLERITVEEARQYIQEGHFKPGSMLPKIQAALRFLEDGGKEVLITKPSCLGEAMGGTKGTRIVRAR